MLNHSKIGLEYGLYYNFNLKKEIKTFLNKKFKIKTEIYLEDIDICSIIEQKFLTKKNKKYWEKVYDDDGAAEFVTFPLEYDGALNTYNTLKNFCKLNKCFKLKFFDNLAKTSSGGFHINLDDISQEAREFLIKDISNRPYLNWCFNDPSDNINSNSFWVFKPNSNSYYHYDINPITNTNKNCAITYRRKEWLHSGNNHIEFRFFDNPQCFEEFKLFIDICLKLRDRAIINKDIEVKKDFKILDSKKKIFKLKENEAWKLTLQFVEKELELKVPIKVKRIWRNRLKIRYQYGPSYLK